MASVTINERTELERLVQSWENRWRIRRILLLLPRVLIAASALAILGVIVLRLFTDVPLPWIAGGVGAAFGAALVLLVSSVTLSGKTGDRAAQYFDELFDMQERVSTALELSAGRIRTVPSIQNVQIADAVSTARNIDPRKHIKLEIRWGEWIGAALLAIILLVLLLFPARTGALSQNSPASQAAIDAAADDVRDIQEDIATNTALDDDERDALLDSLETRLDALESPETQPEDAFVEMSELRSELQEQAEQLRQEGLAQMQSLREASQALQQGSNNPQQTEAGNAGDGTLAEQLADLQAQRSNLSPEQQQQLREALQDAANALRQTNPELAEQMQQAQQALQDGESDAAREALEQARQIAQQAQQRAQERSEAAEQLSQNVEQADESAQQIAEAEAQQGRTSLEQQLQQNAPAAAPLDEGAPGNSGQAGAESAQEGSSSDSGQSGDSDGGNGDEGTDSQQGQGDSGQGENGTASPGQANAQPGQEAASGQSPESGEGSGAGTGETTGRQEGLGGASGDRELGSNDADGRGTTGFEAIYAPNDIDAPGTSKVELEVDDEGAPTIEGDFQENPSGESTVPYDQVFRRYADEANQALDDEYIPLGMRDIVRDYFTSLEPAPAPQE